MKKRASLVLLWGIGFCGGPSFDQAIDLQDIDLRIKDKCGKGEIVLKGKSVGVGNMVLLLPDIYTTAETFLPLLQDPSLAKRYYLLAYNYRGMGGSQAPTDPESYKAGQSTIRCLAKDLEEIVGMANQMGITLLGYGLGVSVILDWLTITDKASWISKIILINGTAEWGLYTSNKTGLTSDPIPKATALSKNPATGKEDYKLPYADYPNYCAYCVNLDETNTTWEDPLNGYPQGYPSPGGGILPALYPGINLNGDYSSVWNDENDDPVNLDYLTFYSNAMRVFMAQDFGNPIDPKDTTIDVVREFLDHIAKGMKDRSILDTYHDKIEPQLRNGLWIDSDIGYSQATTVENLLTQKLCVIASKKDPIYPYRQGRWIYDRAKSTDKIWIELDHHHFVFEENPTAVIEAIRDFLL